MSDSLIPSFLMSNVSELLRSLTKNERCERIAQVAHQKLGTMSDSLRLLTKNEQTWANSSGRSPKMSKWANRSFFWENRSFAHFWEKTSDSLGKPMSPVKWLLYISWLHLLFFYNDPWASCLYFWLFMPWFLPFGHIWKIPPSLFGLGLLHHPGVHLLRVLTLGAPRVHCSLNYS